MFLLQSKKNFVAFYGATVFEQYLKRTVKMVYPDNIYIATKGTVWRELTILQKLAVRSTSKGPEPVVGISTTVCITALQAWIRC